MNYIMADSKSVTPVFDGSRYLGRVKWFNNRAGFGFVTVLEGPQANEDVFAHHSGIKVENEQYKYLVQGEYVEFELRKSDNNDHPYQAGSVTGVKSGMLMCETRYYIRKVPKTNVKAIGIITAVVDARHVLEVEVQEMEKPETNRGKWHLVRVLLKVNKSEVNN